MFPDLPGSLAWLTPQTIELVCEISDQRDRTLRLRTSRLARAPLPWVENPALRVRGAATSGADRAGGDALACKLCRRVTFTDAWSPKRSWASRGLRRRKR